jgi:serine kinase of HPr protein (carbohydrate metabolism regulator)
MILRDIIDKLDLKVLSGENSIDVDVKTAYASDILSDVMAYATKGGLWITNQNHQNVVAIVYFKTLAGAILAAGLMPDEETLAKARDKNVPLFQSELPAFEISGRLYELGIKGCA